MAMAFSINHCELLGNLSRDPELRMTNSGKSVLTLNLVTNHSFKGQDGNYIDTPTFHRVIVWGKIGEWLSKNLHKRDKVYVDGRISTSEYIDKSGEKQRSREIIAENVIPMSMQQLKNIENSSRNIGQETTLDAKTVVSTTQQGNEEKNAGVEANVGKNNEVVNPDYIPF